VTQVKIHHLRYFVAIAREKSLRAAARSLNLAQSALTRGLRDLETDLGIELVERHARGIQLTQAGESYLLRATSALEELRRGQEEAAQLKNGVRQNLTIGLTALIQLTLLPRVLPLFRQRFPNVNLTIDGSLLPHLAARIDDGSMDFCIVPRLSGGLERRFQVETLWSSERTVLARHAHPLSKATSIKDLSDGEWLGVGERKSVEQYLVRLFEKNNLMPPKAISTVDSIPSAIALMLASNCMMVGPKIVPDVDKSIISIDVREDVGNIDVILVKKYGLPLTAPAEYLVDVIRRVAARSRPL
jgi:DNA-binding transcriptional LysR family regulator